MPTVKRKSNFFESEEGLEVAEKLRQMAEDMTFNTASTYSANSTLHPDNRISFVEKHMTYLNTHPMINPREYLSNLRLMTRLR
jgi:hypothetical protein